MRNKAGHEWRSWHTACYAWRRTASSRAVAGCGSARRLWCGGSGGDGERRKEKGVVNAGPRRSIYKAPTGSARCGSFHNTELALTAISHRFRETISPNFMPTNTHATDSLATYTMSLGRENNKAIGSLMRTSPPTIHPRLHKIILLLDLLLVPVLVNLIIK
jgi:hypothetical protein